METSLITPAFAQGASVPGGDMILQFVPFILIFVIMWFLIIRPQQRRVKEHREMVNNVRRGDTIVTTGGIVGKVTRAAEDAPELEVEIADGVKVKLVRGMISEVRTRGEPVKS
jgi:preprotein translocase subunit YajC